MHRTRALALVVFAVLLFASDAAAQRRCCPPHTPPPGRSPHEVMQEFPSAGPMKTAWLVQWSFVTKVGFHITGAWFKRNPADPWIRVLWDARLAEIFVPYHDNSNRFYDMSDPEFFWQLVPATAADAGCCGQLLGDPPVVIREVRDRGPLWKDDKEVYRGEELVLWATLDAANYNYITQYSFRDDGSIGFRAAATSRNYPGAETVAHMHDALWRLDVDLGGWPSDTAMTMIHREPDPPASLEAKDYMDPFNGGVEGKLEWNPLEFTEVTVVDEVIKNGRGHKIQYDLMPVRAGTSRHFKADEEFSRYDFWVTAYDFTQTRYHLVPTYVTGQPVKNADVVLWYASPMHHVPRDEDGHLDNNLWKGSALVMWTGFDLRPRNFFDTTPFFP